MFLKAGGLLSRPSLGFIFLNVVRLLTVVSICLLIAANIVLLSRNVDGYKASFKNNDDNTATNEETPAESCGYVADTDVPKQAGGIFFIILTSIINLILLLLYLLSELEPPLSLIQRLLTSVFPPIFFSPSLSLTFPGLLLLCLTSNMLSHAMPTSTEFFPLFASWFAFVLGGINLLILGLLPFCLGYDVRSARAIFTFGGSKKGAEGLPTPASASFREKNDDIESRISGSLRSFKTSIRDEKPKVINISRPVPAAGEDTPTGFVLPAYQGR
ncbi:hypothetical protein BT69DRAFT_1341513 [Atractiella rhizophila]|nr:hypothetical protein BT69DRAFT_1342231 [Atractiella rhizophila]KAH8915278.1 hypothetical protein BT69DRAFT_1341513 [Atractiella rhizophila]